jgi:hypothetical protein
LWWAAKDDWDAAHNIVMAHEDADCAWVHAHLHRVEGDLDNARYWYRRPASGPRPVRLRPSATRSLRPCSGRVGKIACRSGGVGAMPMRDFAHAVEPKRRTAWATRPEEHYLRRHRGMAALPTLRVRAHLTPLLRGAMRHGKHGDSTWMFRSNPTS